MFKSKKNDTVAIAYPHPNSVAHSWSQSIVQLYDYDSSHKKRIANGGWITSYADSGRIVSARNQLVKEFLTTQADWLFWIDTDMGFEKDSLEKLIDIADPETRPIVGGLCFGQKVVSKDNYGGQIRKSYPTILKLDEEENDQYVLLPAIVYPINQVILCDATGAAFVLVHRSVFEAFDGEDWYEEILYKNNKHKFGEDISFCVRAKQLGFNTFVHTGVKTSHLKEQWITDVDYWNNFEPLEFDIEVNVLTACITSKDFINISNMAKSIKRTTGNAKLFIAISEINSISSFWIDNVKKILKDVQIIETNSNHYPEMINKSIEYLDSEWIVLTEPSIIFQNNWLHQSLTVAKYRNNGCVALNDGSDLCDENIFSSTILINKNLIDGEVYDTRFQHFWHDGLIAKLKKTNLWSIALNAKVKQTAEDDEIAKEIIDSDYCLLQQIV